MFEDDKVAFPAPDRGAGLFDLLDRIHEGLCVALLLGSAAVAAYQVFCRYVLNASLPWPEELSIWLFTWSVFLGMAVAVGRKAHIAIDLVTTLMPASLRRPHAVLVDIIIAAASIVLMVQGWDFAMRAIQVSPAMQLPMRWLFVAAAVGGLLNLFYIVRPRGQPILVRGIAAVLAGAVLYGAVLYGAGHLYSNAGIPTALMISAFGLILLGVPIAFALVFGAFAAFAPLGELMLVSVPQNMAASLNSFTLLAIPFFIMAAAVMNVAGITARLVELATRLVGISPAGWGKPMSSPTRCWPAFPGRRRRMPPPSPS